MIEGSDDGRGVLPFPGNTGSVNTESVVARLPLQGLLCLGLSQAISATKAICKRRFLFVFFRETDAVSRRLVHSGLGRVS